MRATNQSEGCLPLPHLKQKRPRPADFCSGSWGRACLGLGLGLGLGFGFGLGLGLGLGFGLGSLGKTGELTMTFASPGWGVGSGL